MKPSRYRSSQVGTRKSNCQLCRPANQQINTIFLTYTIANTSSAGLPINKSTAFFWHTCSKIELPALPACQSTNQHNFSDIHYCQCQLCRSANQQINSFSLAYLFEYRIASSAVLPINKSTHFLWHTLLPILALPVCQSTNQQLFSDIHVRKLNCHLCRSINQQISTISLTYTLASASSAGQLSNKSTTFFWPTCSKNFQSSAVSQWINHYHFYAQQNDAFSVGYKAKNQIPCYFQSLLCRSVNQRINTFFLTHMFKNFHCNVLWVLVMVVWQSTFQHVFSGIYMYFSLGLLYV